MREETDVVCPACGCACDDLTVDCDREQVTAIRPHCPLAEQWFRGNSVVPGPAALVAEKTTTLDQALARAGELLNHARYPLIDGLSRSSMRGQRAAVRLADRLGAGIDTTASVCHGPSINALRSVGGL